MLDLSQSRCRHCGAPLVDRVDHAWDSREASGRHNFLYGVVHHDLLTVQQTVKVRDIRRHHRRVELILHAIGKTDSPRVRLAR